MSDPTRTVKLKVTFTLDEEYPADWTDEDVLFHCNESSSCRDNLLARKLAQQDTEGYSCCCEDQDVEMSGIKKQDGEYMSRSELCDEVWGLRAQALRAYELATEWKATAEGYRVECEVLKAEVDRLRAENTECRRLLAHRIESVYLDDAMTQLATTNAELERLQAVNAAMSAQIAAVKHDHAVELERLRARTAAEARVLDAMSEIPLHELTHNLEWDGENEMWAPVWLAELARREAVK